MSSRLVTQLITESPTLLLIGEHSSLKTKLERFFTRQGLAVENIPALYTQEEINTVLSRDFYKIVVIGSGEELKRDISHLKHHKNVVVINLLFSIGENQYVSTQSHLLVGFDVIPTGKTWPLLEAVTKKITHRLLLDPQVITYLQSEDRFLEIIKPHLLSPQKKRIVVKGKKHSSDVVVGEISRLLSLFKPDHNFIIKDDFQKVFQPNFNSFEEITGEAEPLPSLLDEAVRNITVEKRKEEVQEKHEYHHQTLQQPRYTPPKVQETPVVEQKQTVSFPISSKNVSDDGKENIITKPFESSILNENSDKVIKPNITSSDSEAIKTKDTITRDENKESFEVDEKLHQIFKVKRVDEKVERVKKIVKETKKIKKTTKKKKILFGVGTLFTFIATGMVALSGLFWITTNRLEKELTEVFLTFSVSQAEAQEIDYSGIESTTGFLEQQMDVYEQIIPPEVFINSRNLVEIANKIVEYDQQKISFDSDIENLTMAFLGKDMFEDILSSQKPSKTAQAYYETSTRLLSRLNDYSETVTQKDTKEKILEFIVYLEKQKESLRQYQQLSPVLDMLLGKEGKKTYAIVFQNNQELRPTGGFVQAVAVLTVDQGMLVDSQVFSSYELDKNLGGAVVPPDDVVRLLGENKWYLRDSNWDPDFSKSGKQMSWFLEQETNRKIDGVIGINLFVIQDILKEMGPLDLDEYNEIITDKNIFERSEFHSEIKLVESSEVEDYQVNLFRYLIRDVMTRGMENPSGLLSALSQSLEEKQLTIYMENQDLLKTFSALSWSGEIITPQCPNQLNTLPCHIDSLVVNEANIGINKANYHTSREDSHRIDIQKEQAKHTRTITLNNTAFTNAWPKGGYKAYFRFYLPLNITSLSITVDGVTVEKESYEIIKENNSNLVGLLIETPIKTEKKIEVRYVVPIEFSLPYSYVFFNQKQPGTHKVLPQITITHDPALSPTLIAPKAEVQGDSIIFDNLNEDHTFVGITFE